jgi:hypothetical protein
MSTTAPDQLEEFLTEYGWKFRRIAPTRWKTGWCEGDRFWALSIEREEHWITFTVSPLLHLAIDWFAASDIARHILELNNSAQIVKLALDEHGDLLLRCQILGTTLDWESFNHVLGILGYYAESLSADITRRVREGGFPEQTAQTLLT